MVFSIKKFSSILCLVYGTGQVNGPLPPECFVMTDNSEDVHSVIHKLSKIFEHELYPIVEALADTDLKENFNSFMKVNLSWYVKMSENPTYFKFMLLCSLVETIVLKMFHDKHCYCVAKILSLCLIAAYGRCYAKLFRKNEEFESFGSYCKRLNPSIRFEDRISRLPADLQQQCNVMLKRLEDVEFENLSLTNFEERILNDALDLVAPEGNLPEDKVTTSTPYENNSFTDATHPLNDSFDLVAFLGNLPEDAITTTIPTVAADVEDTIEVLDLSMSNNSSGVSEICGTCDRRCFKYIDAFQKEIRAGII